MHRCPRCWHRLPATGRCADHGAAIETAAPALPAAPPATLDGIATGTCLAIGGSATVFPVGDDRVVKWGRWRDPELRARFAREARMLRRLDGDGAPRLFASGVVDGWPYLLLERVPGPTLADAMVPRLALADALARWREVVAAVATLHARGVAHGDLKPENVVCEGARARLLDLGLASCDDEPQAQGGGGTLHYAAPEQLAGAVADRAIDVYALGALGFELVTGRPPFVGDRPTVEWGHQMCRPPRASDLVAVPPALDELILECLAKDRTRRPTIAALRARALQGDATPLRSGAERNVARTDRGPAVLAWIVTNDRLAVAQTLATNHGRVVRERADGTLAAFAWLDHDSPIAAALASARELARRGCAVVLHRATVLVRKAGPSLRIHGAAIERAETWRPSTPWTGVLATPQIGADGLAVEDAQTHPGFLRLIDDARTRRSRATTELELVARGGLVADLVDAIAQAWARRRPLLVTVLGASGLGKTRVLDEVRRRVGDRVEATVAIGGAPSLGGRGELGARLADALGSPRGLHDGLRAAAERGTLLVIDDAHWIEDEVLDALEVATAWPHGRLAVIVAATDELARARPRWGSQADAPITVQLPPLTDEAAHRMVRRLLHPAQRVPTPLVERLAARASGNPGALVAIGEEIDRRGLIRRHPGGDEWYVAADELDRIQLEPGVCWRAARELAALPPGMAELVELCSTLGGEFDLAEVEAIQAGLPVAETSIEPGPGLAWLARNRLLRAAAGGFTIASPSLGEAIYAQLDPDVRARLHRAAFDHWSRRPALAGDDGARLARVAHHGGSCGEAAVAGAASIALARAARLRFAHVEAERLATRAVKLLTGVDAAGLADALIERGRARCPLALYEAARVDLADAITHARTAGDRLREIEALIATGAVCDFANLAGDSRAAIERACALAAGGVPRATAARLANWHGVALARQERLPEAEVELDRACRLADELGDHATSVGARYMLGAVLRRRGQIRDGLAVLDRGISQCRAHGDYFHLTVGLFNRINYWRRLGDDERAVADCAQAIELAALHGYGEAELRGWYNLATMRFHLDQPEAALTAARRAHATARRRYGARTPAEATLFLAALEAGHGDAAQATALLAEARPDELDATPWLRYLRQAVELAVGAAPRPVWSAFEATIEVTDPEDRAVLAWLRDRAVAA